MIKPKQCIVRFAHVGLSSDGFPSAEMYWYYGKARSHILRKTDERFQNMDPRVGDWTKEKILPQ